MVFDNPTENLERRNKFLYYLVIFSGFALAVHYLDWYTNWFMKYLSPHLPEWTFLTTIIRYGIVYMFALYLLPMLISFIILKVMNR